MKCDRCGRDNPDHLKFCQDCGNRLIVSAARTVEPTPPRGIAFPSSPIAPPPPSDEPSGHIRSRPPAPDFDFSPRGSDGARHSACPQCGAHNPSESRFCSECGLSLDGGAVQAAASLLAAPVVGIAAAAVPAEERIVCERCRGSNSAAMSFCQYCGARLGVSAEEPIDPRERARTSPESPFARGVPAPAEARGDAAAEPAERREPRPPLPGTPPPPSRRPTGAAPALAVPAPEAAAPSVPPLGTASQAGSLPVPVPAATTGRFVPAPITTAPARLVVIAQDGSPGRDYPLVAEHTDIGRDEGNILLPNDPYVSPRHARIQRRAGRYFVQDLDSVNGIFVRLRAAAKLEHGDLVLMGLEVLRFEVVSAADKGYGPATDRDTQVFGSPAAPRYARLTQRTVEGVARDTYFLTRDETVIGRESGDIVFTGDPFMSRRHSAVTRDPGGGSFAIRDLGSSNGTYLRIRGEHEIVDEDHIRIGQHLFRLEVAPSGQA